ncbi:MAG: phosphonate ABC transporter, permease protein PhnE [Chloroflexi bacterium]|nr:MAG: phosphonate ABC transporter, permease protein PhnE [Chloroflexota bacterium]TMG60907.1 MAG: phosphonate ABC transporter, permease protein PhnE [Chloroflexota bacterium]
MAEYFTARGLPVPRELQRSPLTDWRRLSVIAGAILVFYIGLRIVNPDLSRANPAYAANVILQLFKWDTSILTPQNEFETFWNTAEGLMIATIFLGIVATGFSIVVAIPLSFLGARNIMGGHPVTAAIYVLVRLIFTIIRSIDVLIVVIICGVLIGIGTAAGVVGLAFHNVGVLGKLYSEAIEGIDPGPLEAITATGANRFQVIWTAVIPQIVNPYISFTIYRLDANVRLAPILGYVGGGGIGVLFFQSIQLLAYGAAGLIIFMIVVTVAAMDFASAQIRRRLL